MTSDRPLYTSLTRDEQPQPNQPNRDRDEETCLAHFVTSARLRRRRSRGPWPSRWTRRLWHWWRGHSLLMHRHGHSINWSAPSSIDGGIVSPSRPWGGHRLLRGTPLHRVRGLGLRHRMPGPQPVGPVKGNAALKVKPVDRARSRTRRVTPP